MENSCDGCWIEEHHDFCIYTIIDECPCYNCLVKAMCKVRCETLMTEYAKYVRSLRLASHSIKGGKK